MKKNLFQKQFLNIGAIASILLFNFTGTKGQTLEWAKKIGGNLTEVAYGIETDQSGNVYTTGAFSGTTDFDPSEETFFLTSAGESDIFISKLDALGNFIWAKNIGGIAVDDVYAITVDNDGNVLISGYFQETADFDPSANIFEYASFGNEDIFILKLDTDGNFIWAKHIGSESYEIGESITVDLLGDVTITGSFEGTTDFDPGTEEYNLTSSFSDVYIVKLNSSGNFMWAKIIEGTNVKDAISIMSDLQGDIYITGYFKETADFDPSEQNYELTSFGSFDIYILKLNSFGDFLWAKQMGGALLDSGFDIDVSESGDVYTTGYFNGTVDFDPSETTYNLTAVDSTDFFVTKLNENGDFIWAKTMGGISRDVASAITLDNLGNVYTTGSFSGTSDFDPSENFFNLTSNGSADFFISKLDAQGNFSWALSIGGVNSAYSFSISTDEENNIYATGYFADTTDFDPNAGVFNLISDSTYYDVFVLKINTSAVSLSEVFAPKTSLTLYPNPNNGEFTIKSKSSGEFSVLNQLGQNIKTFALNISNEYNVKIDGLANGIYYAVGTNKEGSFREKIVVVK